MFLEEWVSLKTTMGKIGDSMSILDFILEDFFPGATVWKVRLKVRGTVTVPRLLCKPWYGISSSKFVAIGISLSAVDMTSPFGRSSLFMLHSRARPP